MGALHDGHLSLVRQASSAADFIVMSIFVNPLQFAPTEDLAAYPRPVEHDERLARDAGVDLLFRPAPDEMYSNMHSIVVTAGDLGSDWEGRSRPAHFDGVLTVVAKLLNIVTPDVAVFGQKDLQQAALIGALVRDLDFNVELLVAPIVREPDGLAMSSRNRYLAPADRRSAIALSSALSALREAFGIGERDVAKLEDVATRIVAADPSVKLDYLGIINPLTFKRPAKASNGDAGIIAARIGTTRLIDNMILGE